MKEENFPDNSQMHKKKDSLRVLFYEINLKLN